MPQPMLLQSSKQLAVQLAEYREALLEDGAVIISLQYPDPTASTLIELVGAIGEADSHDHLGTRVWDVRYDPAVDQQNGTRSLTLREFPMHTDASFEVPPPRFVALYVLREDRCGGGLTRLLDSRKLLPHLSAGSCNTLTNSEFALTIPHEFRKNDGAPYVVRVPLLDARGNFRYRRDVIDDAALNAAQMAALAELDDLLSEEKWIETFALTSGTILLLDNGRFFHSRTAVLDIDRHLLRMRFR